jgi:hypothetical protein
MTKIGILSALFFATALTCAPLSALANDILMTINGTVVTGTDYTGVFGPALTSLEGKTFVLVYLINDGLVDSTRTRTSLYTSIVGSSNELHGTPVQSATLTIDGQSISLGVLPINNVASGASRSIDGLPTEAVSMDDSYSVPGSAGYAQTGVALYLDPNLKPPLTANWEEPIYFNFPDSTASYATFVFLHEEVTSSGSIIADTVKSVDVMLRPRSVSLTLAPAKFTPSVKASAAETGFYLGLASEALGWISIVKGGLKKQAEAEFKTIFGSIIQGNDQIYAPSQVELSQGILNALEESAKTPDLSNIMGSVLLGSAIIADIIVLDPPDPNYKKVEPPQPLSWPTTGNKTIDQVIADYLSVMSLDAATLHALERFEAANIASDAVWTLAQQKAFQLYSTKADEARAVLPKDNVALEKALPTVDVNSFPGGAKALAAAYNQQCGKPLGAPLSQILLSLGLTQDAINQAVCTVARTVKPSDITTDYAGPLEKSVP